MVSIESSRMSTAFTIHEESTEHSTAAPIASIEKDSELLPLSAERSSTISAQMEPSRERGIDSEHSTKSSLPVKSSGSSLTNIVSASGAPIMNPYPLTSTSMLGFLMIYCIT